MLPATLALIVLPTVLAGQAPGDSVLPAQPESTTTAPLGSSALIPIGSVFLPGLGQFIHRSPRAGAAFAAAAVGSAVAAGQVGSDFEGDIPRRPREQLVDALEDVGFTAGMLSGWDAFHRAVPAMQRQGKYEFLGDRETVGDLLAAPFDMGFLRRWTTWVDLGQTAVITALVLNERRPDRRYKPYRPHDALYGTSAAYNAAVGEEAIFRGWLLPLLHQSTGKRFWAANALQAGLFGAAHLPDAGWGAATYIGGWAAWEGWVVRRNSWSVRESVFHHFWYNTFVIGATLFAEEEPGVTKHLSFPAIRF